MPFNVERLEHHAWRIRAGEMVRIVRYWSDLETFTPWVVMTAYGRRLWAAFSFESAVRWISRARAGVPGLIVSTALRPASDERHPERS